jgi:hypothetical protein
MAQFQNETSQEGAEATRGGGFELRGGVQFLECRSDRVRETPNRPQHEFLVPWLEVKVMYGARQVHGCLQFALDELPSSL